MEEHKFTKWKLPSATHILERAADMDTLRSWTNLYFGQKYRRKCCDEHWKKLLKEWFDHLFSLCIQAEHMPDQCIKLFHAFIYAWQCNDNGHLQRSTIRTFFIYFANRLENWHAQFRFWSYHKQGIAPRDVAAIIAFLNQELVYLRENGREILDPGTKGVELQTEQYMSYVLNSSIFDMALNWLSFLWSIEEERINNFGTASMTTQPWFHPSLFEVIPPGVLCNEFSHFIRCLGTSRQYAASHPSFSFRHSPRPGRICIFDYPFFLSVESRLSLLEEFHFELQEASISDHALNEYQDMFSEDETPAFLATVAPEAVEALVLETAMSSPPTETAAAEEHEEDCDCDFNSNDDGRIDDDSVPDDDDEDEEEDEEDQFQMVIDRNNLFSDFINALDNPDKKDRDYFHHLTVIFASEEQIARDGGGVQKEAFRLFIQELFAQDWLWSKDEETGYMLPRALDPDIFQDSPDFAHNWVILWNRIGRILGIALLNNMFSCVFASPVPTVLILRILRQESVTWSDFVLAFPGKSKWITKLFMPECNESLVFDGMTADCTVPVVTLKNVEQAPPTIVGSTFNLAEWQSALRCSHADLKSPELQGKVLDRTNRDEMQRYANFSFKTFLGSHDFSPWHVFKQGLLSIIPTPEMLIFHPHELHHAFAKAQRDRLLNVSFLREHSEIVDAEVGASQEQTTASLTMLWDVLSQWNAQCLEQLLLFWTSDVDILRKMNNGYLMLQINLLWNADLRHLLPVSHTCSQTLDLPVYENSSVLDKNLRIVCNYSTGFGII